MIIFKDLSKIELLIAKNNLKENGQTYLYQDGKLYLVRFNYYNDNLVCNRVLQNDLTANKIGVTRDCALLDKWGA